MRIQSTPILGLFAAAVSICVAGCGAIEAIHSAKATRSESFEVPVPTAKQCRIETVNGKVECIAGSADQIQVEAEITARARTIEKAEELVEQITVDHAEIDGVLEIVANVPRKISGSVSFLVTLPGDTQLDVRTSNGQIEMVGMTGGTKARTSNGRIELDECTGAIEAKTSNGSIEIDGDHLHEVNAVSSNGSIEVEGAFAAGKHRIKTSNGKISVEANGRPIRFMAQTSNGKIRANGRKVKSRQEVILGQDGDSDGEIAELALETSNGSISIQHDESEDDDSEDDGDEDGDDDEIDLDEDKRVSESRTKEKKELPIGAAILESIGF